MTIRGQCGVTLIVATCVGTAGCSSSARSVAGASHPGVSDVVSLLCAGVPEAERERPYFFRQAGIDEIREFDGAQDHVKFAKSELRGAEIAIHTTPELTRQRVARVLRCHIAWRDAVGFAVPQRFDDPLVVGHPRVSFDETERGLVIRIAGYDEEQGAEILRRAEALLEQPTTAHD
jgi:hypothetical protein